MNVGLILATQRSGTNALRSILRKCEGVVDLDEILLPTRTDGLIGHLKETVKSSDPFNFTSTDLRILYETYFEKVESSLPAGTRLLLFDCKYDGFAPFNPCGWSPCREPYFLDFCVKRKFKILHLVRENFLDTYVSIRRAFATQEWHRPKTSGAAVVDEVQPKLDANDFKNRAYRWLAESRFFREFLSKYPLAKEVTYATAFQPATLKEIGDFFKVTITDYEPELEKIVKDPRQMKNYAELERLIRDDPVLNKELGAFSRPSDAPRVTFLIAGVQKGGTTSLAKYLGQHPRVCVSKQKELHFFDEEKKFAGTPDYEDYHKQFAFDPGARVIGEATPIYSYWPEAMRRIWEYNREMRLIVLFRHPVERAWSHWKMETSRQADPLSFSEAIRQESVRSREALPWRHRVFSYVDRGFYAEQIRNIQRFFPREQVLYLKSEDFFASPPTALRQVSAFLALDDFPFDVGAIYNAGPDLGTPLEEDRQFLIDCYRQDIHQTEKMLGWDCADWLR